MQLISKFNKQIHILQCVVDIYSKYAWNIPLKYEKDIAITIVFQKILNESNCCEAKSKGFKPNKIWVDKGSEFYNRSMTSWFEKNDVEMYSMHKWREIFSLKDLLEHWEVKFISIWQKMCILIN